MKSVSKDYLKYITENNFLEYSYRVEIITNGGKTTTEYDGEVIQKFEINGTESSSGFAIGNTLSMQLSLSLLLSEKTEIPTSSIVKPYIKYTWNNSSEEMCMGIFYVNSVDIDHRHKISIKASDAMSATELLGGVYTDPKVEPPVNSKFLVKDMVGKFPGQLSLNEDAIPDIEINTLMFNEHIVGKTFREILGYIAAVNGGFARVNYTEEGLSEIQFTTYKKVNGIVLTMKDDEYSKIKSIKSGKNKFRLKQIATEIYVKNEEAGVEEDKEDASAYSSVTVTSGDKDAKPYELVTFTCPIISNSLSNLSKLDRIYNLVKDVEYYPVDATLFGYHFLECGDIITIENTYGELLDLYIQDIKINVIGGVMVSVSSTYDYTKTTPLKNSVTTRVDTLTKQVETFASRFAVTDQKIDMAVSKAEVETVIQENLENLNMGVNSWIREVYNMDGAVENIEEPRAVHFQGKQAIISDIFKDPNFPLLSEFEGARTTRYATCVKVVERTTIGIMVKQVSPLQDYLPKLKNVAVYINSQERKAIPLKTIGNQPVEGTENEGYYTYNAVLNAGWNVIEVLHYEPVGSGIEVKCGGISIGDITVEDLIVNIDNLNNAHALTESPELDLVNCNALSINYTRFVGAEFTIESDAIKQVVTEVKENTTSIGNLEVSFDKINARVESTEKGLDSLEERYTEISNTPDEIRLVASKVEEIETKVNENESAINRVEKQSELFVKSDEIGTIVQEETSQRFNDIETNYAQKSELSQTKTDITMSFSQSGGYNLIQESAFYNNDKINSPEAVWKLVSGDNKLPFACLTYEDPQDRAYPDANANTLYVSDIPLQENSTNAYLEQDVVIARGKTYTFSVLFASKDTAKWSEIKLELYADKKWREIIAWQAPTEENKDSEEEYIKHMGNGGKDVDDWTKCVTRFSLKKASNVDDSATSVKIRIRFTNCKEGANISIVHPLLVEGEFERVYSPSPNEMYTGITRINKDGIKISRSDSTTSTSIDYKGVTIVNDEAVLAEFKSNNAYMPVARIDKIVDSPIPSKRSLTDTLVVDSNAESNETTFRTLQECFNAIPDITSSKITIEVKSNTNGGYIKDRTGSPIEIILDKDVKIGSPLIFSNINNAIDIHSAEKVFSESNYNYGYVRGVACANCHNVTISYLHLDELAYPTLLNDLGIGIDAYTNISTAIILEHSDATVKYCNVLRSINQSRDGVDFSCIVAARNSRCMTFNMRGNSLNNTFVRYVYVSLGYSHLYIARHTSLLLDTNDTIDTSTVTNVLPLNIRLIKFPNNEANLTTFTNREYEADSEMSNAFPNDSRLPESGVNSPDYEEITELESIYASSRTQQTRYFDTKKSTYTISANTTGGSSVGTVYRNNLYYYDRTIFEFDPERFRSALQGAQTKVYDENGNPVNGETPLTASLVIEAESIGEYSTKAAYPSDRYVPVNITMYSNLDYAYDTNDRKSADPKFNEGINGKFDYVPNNVESSNTIYLDDNDANWSYDNHGFYPGNMTIEIPLQFYMANLHNNLSSTYKNGAEDLKNGKARYVIVDTGIYALDDNGKNIQGDTASVKLKNAYFKLSYNVNLGSTSPEVGEEEDTVLYVPDFSDFANFEDKYREWCQRYGITFNTRRIYDANIEEGGFIECSPSIGSPIYTNETLTVIISAGLDPELIPVTIPDYTKDADFESKYRTWCSENSITLNISDAYSSTIASGGFISIDPTPGTRVYKGDSILLVKSKGRAPVTCKGAPSEDDAFPVFQRRYMSPSTGEFVFHRQNEERDEYELEDYDYYEGYDVIMPNSVGIRSVSSFFAQYSYTESDLKEYCRAIHKFFKNDFITLLENADEGSIQASIVIFEQGIGRRRNPILESSNKYYNHFPFKLDIHSNVNTICDNPSDITGKCINSMYISGDSNNVFCTEKDYRELGLRVPIHFIKDSNNNGERDFKNGKLTYVVLDAYQYDGDFYSFIAPTENYPADEHVFIEVKFTENGVVKNGRINPINEDFFRHLDISNKGKIINQQVKFALNNEQTYYDKDGSDYSHYSYIIDNYTEPENYEFVTQQSGLIGSSDENKISGLNRVEVSLDASGNYNFNRVIFEFDPSEFAKRLPKDFATSENYKSYLLLEVEYIDKYTNYQEHFNHSNYVSDYVTFGFSAYTYLDSDTLFSINNHISPHYSHGNYVYDESGRISVGSKNGGGFVDHNNTTSTHIEWYQAKQDTFILIKELDTRYDGLQDILDGKLRYVVVQPIWVEDSHEDSAWYVDFYNYTSKFRVKNVRFSVEGVNSYKGTVNDPTNASVLSIEPWYLDEE